MHVRITRQWRASDIPDAHLEAGQVFRMPASLAVYFLAMNCAEVLPARPQTSSAEPRLLFGAGVFIFGALLWRQRMRAAH
jgi:hypothetical protein